MSPLLLCTALLALAALYAVCRNCSVIAASLVCALTIAACSIAVAGDGPAPEPLSFAAVAGKRLAAAPPIEPLEFGCVARRAAPVASVPPVSFAAVARRAEAPQVATTPKLKYRHTDGVWRDQPQPGLSYYLQDCTATASGLRCINGQCFLR